jgi:methyl-accepting chemotaxis protein
MDTAPASGRPAQAALSLIRQPRLWALLGMLTFTALMPQWLLVTRVMPGAITGSAGLGLAVTIVGLALGMALMMESLLLVWLCRRCGLTLTGPWLHQIGLGAQLQQGAESVNSQAEKLAAAANEILFAGQMQGMATDGVKGLIDQVSQSVAQVTEVAGGVKAQTEQAEALSSRGGNLVDEVAATMAEIERVMDLASTRVHALSAQARDIGAVADTITRVASQTNLLALNAAIEAARAGPHGRGFAVVAQEVKQLSTQTAEATRSIVETISRVQHEVKDTAAEIELAMPLVQQGVARVHEAADALHEIHTGSAGLQGQGERLAEEITQQGRLIDEMVSGMAQILETGSQTQAVAERALETSMALSTTAAELMQAAQGQAAMPAAPAASD